MDMSKKWLVEGFSEEKEKQYEREARLEYGPEIVNKSVKLWNSYTKAEKEAIGKEGQQVYDDLVDALEAGRWAQSLRVQAILDRWRSHRGYFYEPTLEILCGLGELYNTNPDFIANFKKLHPDLPAFLQETISQYVDDLENAEIERMLAEDEAKKAELDSNSHPQ